MVKRSHHNFLNGKVHIGSEHPHAKEMQTKPLFWIGHKVKPRQENLV